LGLFAKKKSTEPNFIKFSELIVIGWGTNYQRQKLLRNCVPPLWDSPAFPFTKNIFCENYRNFTKAFLLAVDKIHKKTMKS